MLEQAVHRREFSKSAGEARRVGPHSATASLTHAALSLLAASQVLGHSGQGADDHISG